MGGSESDSGEKEVKEQQFGVGFKKDSVPMNLHTHPNLYTDCRFQRAAPADSPRQSGQWVPTTCAQMFPPV